MNRLEQYFENVDYNQDLRFEKRDFTSLPSCFKPTILGEPRWGMLAQYRCGLYHAYEFDTYWEIHKDKRNPETHPIEHLVEDAPHWLVLGGIAAGVIAGAFLDAFSREVE